MTVPLCESQTKVSASVVTVNIIMIVNAEPNGILLINKNCAAMT